MNTFANVSQLSDDAVIEMIANTDDIGELFNALSTAKISSRPKKDVILKAISDSHGLPYADTLEKVKVYSEMSPEFMIRLAANNGDIRVVTSVVDSLDVNTLSETLEDALNYAVMDALTNGHKDVFDKLLPVTEGNNLQRLHWAARGGNAELVSQFVEVNGGLDRELLGIIISMAAEEGHVDLMKQYINLLYSPYGSKRGIGRMILTTRTNQDIFDYAIKIAARNGQKDIVKYLISVSAPSLDYDGALFSVSGNVTQNHLDRNVEIARMLISAGAKNLNKSAVFAAEYGNTEIVKELLLAGASNYQEIAETAFFEEHNGIEALVYQIIYQNGPHA